MTSLPGLLDLKHCSCLNDFSDPIDQDIHTQCALGWRTVVSEKGVGDCCVT